MTSTQAWSKPPQTYCEQLQEFERQFDYPLTDSQRFRIEHSLDYERFFAAMGDSVTVVVESAGKILGVLSAAIRTLHLSEGRSEKWLYIGDVKIEKSARGRHVLKRLFMTTHTWVDNRCTKAYSVVMDGTGVTPRMYTGRLGIPEFRAVQSIKLLAFATQDFEQHSVETASVQTCEEPKSFAEPTKTITTQGSKPHWSNEKMSIRSRISPVWLNVPDTGCFGLLEDTRSAKRLYDSDSNELLYAHLSNVKYRSIEDLVPIVFEAGKTAYTFGCTNLLLAVPAGECSKLTDALGETQYEVFSSTVYATEKTKGYELPISSSEI